MAMTLVEKRELRNQHALFEDRREAGLRLGELISRERKAVPPDMVLAIPSGGVPVGLGVAERLKRPLDLIIVRKLQIPGNTEAGFGAMTMDGEVLLNHDLMAYLDITAEQVEAEKRVVAQELKRRNRLFRKGRPLPDVADRDVLLVDDGLASGFTLLAAARSLRSRGARRISAAVPTAPLRSVDQVSDDLDVLFCLNVVDRPGSFAVAAAYRFWRDLETDEVLAMLEREGVPG